MKISIVILNWNREDDTIKCLKSVSKINTGKNKFEIVVVDNNSKKSSVKKIQSGLKKIFASKRKFEYQLIENKENLGFAEGNNVGIKYSFENKNDFVIVLNNDTNVDKEFAVNLLKTAKDFPNAGAISPKIYFAQGYEFHKDRYKKRELGKVVWYAGGQIDWKNVYGSNRGVDEVDNGIYEEVEPTDFATGSCVLLKKEAVEQVGMFDKKYFMYFEDTDLSIRMKKKNWLVLYSPKAFIWHKVAQSSRIGSDLNDYFIHRNRLLFGMRYAPLRTKFALLRESIKFLLTGREWQKRGVRDYYLRNFEKGSWGK